MRQRILITASNCGVGYTLSNSIIDTLIIARSYFLAFACSINVGE